MAEQKKSTLTVNENDILTLSQKIQKNIAEDKAFAESLDKYLANPDAVNKEKAEEMFHSRGLQLSKENTFFNSDSSIAYSTENVNTISAKNSRENAEKLLPFLNVKYHYHLGQIANFESKKSERLDRVAYHKTKIENLTDKASRLAHSNKVLKSMFGKSIFALIINAHIERNEAKIKKINEKLIPKHSKKIDALNDEIALLEHKIEVKQCKADKLFHLSNLIKSFAIFGKKRRHKLFSESLDGLIDASQRSLKFKIEKCNANINELNEKNPESEKLPDLKLRQTKLLNKLQKLQKSSLSVSEQPFDVVENLIVNTESQINDAVNTDNFDIVDLSDDICISSVDFLQNGEKVTENDKESISDKSERETYQKINPEYYTSLNDNRYTKKMNDNVADLTMKKLKEQDIEYSAVRLAKNITGVTVHKDYKKSFDNAMYKSITEHKNKAVESQNKEKSYNSEYYKSLPKENRFISEFATKTAQEYIAALSSADCKYSYRIKNSDRIAVTIDNKDKVAMQVYNQFTNSIDVNHARENVIDELSERGFTSTQVNFIKNLLENPDLNGSALYSFVDKIKPEYNTHQIYTIYDSITDIYAQSELDRIQDKDNLYSELIKQIKDFDCEINLQSLTEGCNYTESQKNELLNAIKSGVPTDALSMLDESYSAEDIHNYIAVYQSYVLDKINKFHQEHKDRLANSEKKTLTVSRGRIKDNAQRVSNEKSKSMQKTVDFSI